MKLSRKRSSNGRSKRDFVVVARGVRRTEPDISRLMRTSLDYYMALLERDGQLPTAPTSRRIPGDHETGGTNDAA